MAQITQQQSSSITSENASTSGLSQEFLDMLEPSFALVKRLEKDQHRTEAGNELKLQSQLNQFWQKIGRLELYAHQSEVEKAAFNERWQTAEQDKALLGSRIQKLENDNAVLVGRITALERDSATQNDSASPETATPSATATPEVVARANEIAPDRVLSGELDAILLHPKLPKLLFLLDPVRNKISDGSEFPLSMLSSLRSILTKMIAENSVSANKLAQLRIVSSAAFTIKSRCVYRYLRKSDDRRKCVWTKEHEQSYACRTCVNKQRLCMKIAEGRILVLPLHPLFRTSSTLPTELDYWVAPKAMSTAKAPYNVDIWSVPAGQH